MLQRCVDSLRDVSPRAETVVAKLSACERHHVKMALARLSGEGHEQPEGCLNEACADKQTVWITREYRFPGEPPLVISRCSRCDLPKAHGRTWNGTLWDCSMALLGVPRDRMLKRRRVL